MREQVTGTSADWQSLEMTERRRAFSRGHQNAARAGRKGDKSSAEATDITRGRREGAQGSAGEGASASGRRLPGSAVTVPNPRAPSAHLNQSNTNLSLVRTSLTSLKCAGAHLNPRMPSRSVEAPSPARRGRGRRGGCPPGGPGEST